ncbi:MAG: hypothetical protein SNF33_02470 [Candidatus Algichlamydia australiensis]|nr:hypothetical protein [Chlamydiales bacterium]
MSAIEGTKTGCAIECEAIDSNYQKLLVLMSAVNFVAGGFFTVIGCIRKDKRILLGAFLLINSIVIYSYSRTNKVIEGIIEDDQHRQAIGESEEKRREAIDRLERISSNMSNTADTMHRFKKEVVGKTEQLQKVTQASTNIGEASKSLFKISEKLDELIAAKKESVEALEKIIENLDAQLPLKTNEEIESDPLWIQIKELNRRISNEPDPKEKLRLEFERLALKDQVIARRTSQIPQETTD